MSFDHFNYIIKIIIDTFLEILIQCCLSLKEFTYTSYYSYFSYLENLKKIEKTDNFFSIMHSNASLSNYIYIFGEKICKLNCDLIFFISILFVALIFTANAAIYWKEKYDSSNPKFCQICLENVSNVVMVPCGHLCVCKNCLKKWLIDLKKDYKNFICIMCRNKIQYYFEVYF